MKRIVSKGLAERVLLDNEQRKVIQITLDNAIRLKSLKFFIYQLLIF